ncbi:MAG: response regulator, partial [Bacteroidota bacterium]
MHVLIVEDEPLAAEHLQRMLLRYDPKFILHPPIDTVRQAVAWLQTHPMPDLILMDIRLADGLSFSIFEEVPVQTPIIFTTAYDSFTIQAFKVNSVDYLLKPIAYEELTGALDKFHQLYPKSYQPSWDVANLKQALQSLESPSKKRFLVKKGEILQAIPTTDIQYFYAEDKVT